LLKTPFTKCYCGAKRCKGFLGVSTAEDSDEDGAGAPVIPPNLEDMPKCKECSDYILDLKTMIICKGECCGKFD